MGRWPCGMWWLKLIGCPSGPGKMEMLGRGIDFGPGQTSKALSARFLRLAFD